MGLAGLTPVLHALNIIFVFLNLISRKHKADNKHTKDQPTVTQLFFGVVQNIKITLQNPCTRNIFSPITFSLVL